MDEIFYSSCSEQDLRINWLFYELHLEYLEQRYCALACARVGVRERHVYNTKRVVE